MIDKITGVKPKQALDQSLISIGGWLRSIDAQMISFIRSEDNTRTGQNIYLHQHRRESDVSEWIYPDSTAVLNPYPGLSVKKWYKNLVESSAAWHTNRDWRSPLPGLSRNQKFDPSASQVGILALEYAYASPSHHRTGFFPALGLHQHPSFQSPEGLSQFWSASYQFSTALAVLLPIAVNIAQSPAIPNFVAEVSHNVKLPAISLEVFNEAVKPTPIEAPTVKVAPKTPVRPQPPTGKIANIQSYTLPTKGAFTSGYGMRWGRAHRGIDLAAPIGTPIVAAAAGKVVTAGWSEDGFGNKVEIQHPDGTITLYAHSSRILTRVGAMVHQGEQIAEVGTSGFSTGPHLHFQIHPQGKEAVDPLFFFSKNKALMAMKPISGS
jgi:murein DD-endopeptidase MepM/ murein hydrolase activator NlpD